MKGLYPCPYHCWLLCRSGVHALGDLPTLPQSVSLVRVTWAVLVEDLFALLVKFSLLPFNGVHVATITAVPVSPAVVVVLAITSVVVALLTILVIVALVTTMIISLIISSGVVSVIIVVVAVSVVILVDAMVVGVPGC